MVNVAVPRPDTETVAVREGTWKIPGAGIVIWLVSAVDMSVKDALLNALVPRLPLAVPVNV
jgi:hypothetical protein